MGNSRASRITLAILNIIGFIGVVVINTLANILPLNNLNTGAISDKYPNLFVPAGLTFSIWGIIYILLAIFVIYGMVSALKKEPKENFIEKIGILFFITCLANVGWIFAWHYQIVPLSLALMLVLFGLLLAMYLRLSIGISNAPSLVRYFIHLPISVYLGWISIATIANVAALLISVGIKSPFPGEAFWAVITIAIGIAITIAMLLRRNDVFYCMVVVWALIGILMKRLGDNPLNVSIIVVIIAGFVLISAGIIIQLVRRKAY
jgi:hypothetical protein